MTVIREYIDHIDDELCDSKRYAEAYVQAKASNDSYWMDRYHEMALDELKHAEYIHELVTKKIKEISNVLVPPQKMMDRWEAAHREYVEKAAWVKQMLSL